jgi:hypothetical protein
LTISTGNKKPALSNEHGSDFWEAYLTCVMVGPDPTIYQPLHSMIGWKILGSRPRMTGV